MNTIVTIIPIFTVIAIGSIARKKNFMPLEFTGPANRLVYYVAIPAMIFRSVSKGDLTTDFHFRLIAVTLGVITLIFAFAWVAGLILRVGRGSMAAFVQSAFHGNLGYIGLAVSYYYLGDEGLVRASIIAGFMMILQNFLAVIVNQFYADRTVSRTPRALILKMLGNPIILAAIAGILFSLTKLDMPLVIGRSLDILSSMALPMALLIIGASLSFEAFRLRIGQLLVTNLMKLVVLPGLGLMLYLCVGIQPQMYMPGLILLAAPSATIVYVMAKEMDGDEAFAVASVSFSTLLSALMFSVWLGLAE